MKTTQHTLKQAVSFSGTGLMTGTAVEMSFLPAPPQHGLKFQRTDVVGQPIIAALLRNVVRTHMCTTLAIDDTEICLVEHVLAALTGLQVDNALITLNGPEPPIMDGGALDFVNGIKKVGLTDQGETRRFFRIQEEISFQQDGIEIKATPLDGLHITVMTDFSQKGYGNQYAVLKHIDEFASSIAPARTFGFLHDVISAFDNGTTKGASAENTLIIKGKQVSKKEISNISTHAHIPIEINDRGLINDQSFRFPNEMSRHKLLDIMGDLALLGRPIMARITATNTGHKGNVAFVQKIQKNPLMARSACHWPPYDPNKTLVMDAAAVKECLPHRPPFLFVDGVFYLTENSIGGFKHVTQNEDMLRGHFPGRPIFPGVLQIELLAQLGAVRILQLINIKDSLIQLFGVRDCRFRQQIRPGDTMVAYCKFSMPLQARMMEIVGEVYVRGQLTASATCLAGIVK